MKRDNSVQDRDIKFYLDEEKKSKAGQHLSSQDDVGPDWLTMSVALAKLHLVTIRGWSFQAQKVWKIFYMGLALAYETSLNSGSFGVADGTQQKLLSKVAVDSWDQVALKSHGQEQHILFFELLLQCKDSSMGVPKVISI
ncbi:hypothetical protein QAD02_011347 [Eretmocerus hayati]|uniref:Uncharacterized protein n=1 Tax=Eretmocerus hayati TaxID=131215 RepID=A0ACC2NWN7_9HYME|nr:hypothetical protein QAD02_011347 [Eretmocerus hayati]